MRPVQRKAYGVKLDYINELVNDIYVKKALDDNLMDIDNGIPPHLRVMRHRAYMKAQSRRRNQLNEAHTRQEENRQAHLQSQRPTPQEIQAQQEAYRQAQEEAEALLEASRLQEQIEAQAQIEAELEAQARTPVRPVVSPARPVVSPARMSDNEIDAELDRIRDDVLRTVDNHQLIYNETALDRFNLSFRNAADAMYRVRDAYRKKIRFDNLRSNYNGVPSEITYPFKDGYTILYKTTHTLFMWAMQLPHQFDRIALLKSMLYLIGTEKIYAIVDLQDCVNTNVEHPDLASGIGCNPYDRTSSEDVYSLVMSAIEPHKPKRYHRITNYFDMSSGFPSAWYNISKIDKTTDKENSVVIHCLGGKGRSGSVLLYLFLRDNIIDADMKKALAVPHLGYQDISHFMLNMNTLLFYEPDTPLNPTTPEILDSKEDASNEIFKIGSSRKTTGGITVSRLFRQRLNRIFFFLARDKRVSTFYNYACPAKRGDTYIHEFNYPTVRTVDWDEYDKGTYDSDRTKEWEWFS